MTDTALTINAVLVQCNAAQTDLSEGKLVRANGTLRTAIDILTKYILKVRLGVQDDLDLFSRLKYLQANKIITDTEFQTLDTVRRAGNDAIHDGANKATADEIRQRIAGVYAMASKADDIAPAPGKYDDLWYDSNGNKLESYSIFGMTAGGLIEAIQTHDTEHINNEARSVIYYVVKEATGRNMETVKQAVKYAKHISKRTIGAENREAVLRCAQYAVGDDPSDELFDSAANMVRHLNDIIERISKRKMRRHNPVLREIFGSLDFFKPVMDTVVFCIELILYGVSCGGFCFMLIYGIGTVVTLIERSGTAELLGVLRLFGISAAVCVGCLAAAVFIGWIWDTYFDGGLSRD